MRAQTACLILLCLTVVACGITTNDVERGNNTYLPHVKSGGVPQDGIPSIDDPRFINASQASLSDGAVVFGVHRNGTAKAYPQRILVHHEIVNDAIAGENIAVTYCPLTGTAIGFERGNTTLGVSGKLLNSNLVMYDRATESWYPQILGEAIKGPRTGSSLQRLRVIWTTWEEWRRRYPNTTVLSENTGYIRDYDDDPYGDYNPRSGYYANNDILFPVMHKDNTLTPKTVVYAYQYGNVSFAVTKERLQEQRVVRVNDTSLTMIYDPVLDTARLYRTNATINASPTGYTVQNSTYKADQLPMPEKPVFAAFWFSWAAFNPDTALYD